MANATTIRGKNPPTPKGAPDKTASALLPNVAFDPATQKFLNSNYGTEASWYNDPQIGPILKAALSAGKNGTALQGQQYQDFIRTHAVVNGTISRVAPDKSWYGTHGSQVRLTFGQKISDPGTYNANVKDKLDSYVTPLAKFLGISLDPTALNTVAENAYVNGWTTTDQIKDALLKQPDWKPNTPFDPHAIPAGGELGKANAGFSKIAADYGVPLPKDPEQLKAYIKGAVGPGGSEESMIEYAKGIAKAQYPWMSAAIDAGVTPKAYLTPYATNISNTLDLPQDSINWQDPKWSSLLTSKDPKTNATSPSTFSDVMTKIKTDPQYRYDYTTQAKSDAYNLGSQLKQMFGFGA